MSREKELIKNTFVLSLGKFLPKLTSIITLPILTAYLTKSEYGTYDLISTLVMLVIPIATLQIQSAAFRFLIDSRKDKQRSSQIITNIFIVTLPICIVASFIIQFFFHDFSSLIRLMISLYFLIDTIYLTVGQITRGLGNNKDFSLASIILSVTNMIGIFIGVYLTGKGLLGVLISLFAAQVIGTLYLLIRTNLFSYISVALISGKVIKELISYSWPMIPNNLSNWVLKLSDRLVITAVLGIEANAVYSVANKIPNLLSMAQNVIIMAWQENASISVKDKDSAEYYSKMLDSMFSLMFGCTALLIAGTPILFALLIKGDYADAYYQMPVLILAMFFYVMSAYFGGLYIAHKKTVNVGISTMIAAGINLIIDICLVNIVGIWAGSISTLIAYIALYFYRMWNCKQFQPITVNLKKQLLQIAMMIAMLVMCFQRNIVFDIFNVALGIIFFIAFNNKMIKVVTKKLLRKND